MNGRHIYSQQEMDSAVADERARCAGYAKVIAEGKDEPIIAVAVALKILSQIEDGDKI